MRSFSSVTRKAFDRWTDALAWGSGNAIDDARFYDFMRVAYIEGVDSGDLTAALERKVGNRLPALDRDETLQGYAARFHEIASFLRHVGYSPADKSRR
jgi:hypothetical protein